MFRACCTARQSLAEPDYTGYITEFKDGGAAETVGGGRRWACEVLGENDDKRTGEIDESGAGP